MDAVWARDTVGAGALLTIDLDALVENYRGLAERAAPAACSAVVKADAYGLGVEQVVPALRDAGCRHFFTAQLREALEVQPHAGRGAAIYVLNGLQPGSEALCAEAGIVPVLNGTEQVEAWMTLAVRLGRSLPAVIQIDSGMSRLGLAPEEVEALASRPGALDGIDLILVMTHLACGDEATSPYNGQQLDAFLALAARLPPAPLSIANSGGVALGGDFRQDLVRPGVALYGVAPTAGRRNPMRPVVRLDARVIQTRAVKAGQAIGYGCSLVADRPMELATIAVGYADGWPRCLGHVGAAYKGAVRLPIAGRVSMDSIILDISDLPEDSLRLGDTVELIGPNQTLEQVAADAGTIPYEILTGLGRRYARRILPPSSSAEGNIR
ncbi:alanine racemase [Aureimonas sp. Leaf454]|uniref:alanine racemase n=1 Tax=Aureimonas sp. Leaf454 TaxID=1736381 RepID=UPI0006F5C91A|nr:alanine racemase [Aureimonas sp. Leaf454]KQT50969.1 alanine racemase [Aureimonas sp. Leaf454]